MALRSITATFTIYKYWDLPKESRIKAGLQLVKIFPIIPGEDHSTKFKREWDLEKHIRDGNLEMLDRTQRDYYEKAEFFADGELYVEGITWQPKMAKVAELPINQKPEIQPVKKIGPFRLFP